MAVTLFVRTGHPCARVGTYVRYFGDQFDANALVGGHNDIFKALVEVID